MRSALKSFGIESYGYVLNRADFGRLSTPAILLEQNHYLVVKEIAADYMKVYDPLTLKADGLVVALPAPNDPDFRATVLAFKPVETGGRS